MICWTTAGAEGFNMGKYFPLAARQRAVELFEEGVSTVAVCRRIEEEFGRRPGVAAVRNWVRRAQRGESLRSRPHTEHPPGVKAAAVAARLTGRSIMEVADTYGVSVFSVVSWTQTMWPDPSQAASLSFDEVVAETIKRMDALPPRPPKRAKRPQKPDPEPAPDQRQPDLSQVPADALAWVDQWVPGPGPVPDLEDLPADYDAVVALLKQERDRNLVKDAMIHGLYTQLEEQTKRGGPGKADGRRNPTNAVKTHAVDFLREHTTMTIKQACEAVGIAKSSYHDQLLQREQAQRRQQHRDQITSRIAAVATELDLVYGYRRIHAHLKQQGVTVSEKIVLAVMRETGLRPPAKASTKFSSYKGETSHRPDNLLLMGKDAGAYNSAGAPRLQPSRYFSEHGVQLGLTHDFHADAPWQKIGTDVTQIRCSDGYLYLSAAIDFFDGYPIAVTMSSSPDARLVEKMIRAIDAAKPDEARPIIHSDRGSLYRTPSWVRLISDPTHNTKGCTACQEGTCVKRWRYIPSLSRKGNSGDNARVEGFFGTLKQERIHGRDAARHLTRAEMAHYIEDYIDFYINHRLKSTLGNGYTTIAQHRQTAS